MGATAFVFPGQGSQKAGMAADFHARFGEAREVFAEASEAVGYELTEICFGEDARLALTEFQQPAILATEIAMVRCLQAHFGIGADFYGGHSLGEYTALVAAGVIDLARGAALVAERGRLMQAAVPPGAGAMTAVITKEDLDVEALAAALGDSEVDIANHNAANQAVLSGAATAVEAAVAALKNGGAFTRARFIPLRVSAPFHSRLMSEVQTRFTAVLEADCGGWRPERAATVTSNFSGGFHQARSESLVAALGSQIAGRVRWVDNMRCLDAAATRIVEVGPGRPLRGFFASLGREVESVTGVEGAEALASK